MPPTLRKILSASLLVLTLLGLLNVYSDNTEVLKKAAGVACENCDPHLVQVGRSPLAQTITYQTAGSTLVTVVCQRSLILLGEYECLVKTP